MEPAERVMESKKTEEEVELKEITTAEDKEDKEKKTTNAKSSNVEEEIVAEGNVYSTLSNPSEHVYGVPSSTQSYIMKEDTSPDIHRKIRVYRMISLILFAICVLLMIVVLVLSVKLTGKQPCEIVKDTDRTPLVQECSLTKCQEIYKQQLVHVSEQCVCSGCGRDWLHFEDSCYFLSQDRLNWQKSREECQKKGGDLAIITNERVQMYLTEKGKLHYWIGLNHVGTNQWEWINNSVLTVRYWGDVSSSGDCALLATNEPPAQSWHRSSCRMYLQYICQKSLGSP